MLHFLARNCFYRPNYELQTMMWKHTLKLSARIEQRMAFINTLEQCVSVAGLAIKASTGRIESSGMGSTMWRNKVGCLEEELLAAFCHSCVDSWCIFIPWNLYESMYMSWEFVIQICFMGASTSIHRNVNLNLWVEVLNLSSVVEQCFIWFYRTSWFLYHYIKCL